MAKVRMRDIVVLLPGITGSVLQKDGKDVWAISGQAVWKALTSLGSSLQQLMLGEDDPEIDDVGDGREAECASLCSRAQHRCGAVSDQGLVQIRLTP